MSLGGPGCDATYCDALGKAKRAGVAFAVAAGNENKLASQSTPACCAAVMSE
jgi:subtilisin family serine protease